MSFRLKTGDREFNTRVDALFSSLQTAARDLEPQVKRKHEDDDAEERTEESDDRPFRQPQGRPPQWRGRGGRRGLGPRNSTPDYVKNPQNWTRYNMRDTRILSDSENKREGLKLLAHLEGRTGRDYDEAQPKIIFKKPSPPPPLSTPPTAAAAPPPAGDCASSRLMEVDEEAQQAENAEFGGSKKFVMQEYVVGKAKSKPKEKVAAENQVTHEKGKKEIKLSYLMFEEED